MVYFDFNLLKQLACDEPERFESLRKQLIEYEISKAHSSNRKRLHGLQFQIDMERERARSAMGACIGISRIMMNKFHKELKPGLNIFMYDDKVDVKSDANSISNKIIELPKN